MKVVFQIGAALLGVLMATASAQAQEDTFKWVNALPDSAHERLSHGTFRSDVMNLDVGYVIYLPPGYEAPENQQRRYPVVYYLHGWRQGRETRGIYMAEQFDRWIHSGHVLPRIYVFVHGGKLSHYDYQDSLAETAFIKELIPHIDKTYRTTSNRSGRGIEGFSMGGRGTARDMFKYPELFCSAVPIGGGHQHEKRVSEDNGQEREGVVFEPTNNSWDLARQYAARTEAPALSILVVVGTNDFNYEANLEWMNHLRSLSIPFEQHIVAEAGHDVVQLYQELGDKIMQFHERCFASKVGDDS